MTNSNSEKRIVHMTSLIKRGCERQIAYRYSNTDKIPVRWAAIRGTIVHRAIELVLKDGESIEEVVDLAVAEQEDWPAFENIGGDEFEDMGEMVEKAITFLESEGLLEYISKSKEGVERTEMYTDGNITLTGTMDLFIPSKSILIDWKSGKGTRKNNAHFLQLRGYSGLLELNGEDPPKSLLVVYLGNDDPTIPIVRKVDGAPMTQETLKNMLETEDQFITSIMEKPLEESNCYESYLCNYCSYRHICLGL